MEMNIHTQEIDLREYLYIVKRRWWIIALFTLGVLAAAALYTFMIVTPMYESSTTVMVSSPVLSQNPAPDINELNLNRRLAETYGEIVRSRRVATQVIAGMNLTLTPEALNNKIQVSQVRDTEFIRIAVTDPDPALAAAIANNTAEAFQANIVEIMNVNNVSILDEAVEPSSPVSPNKPLTLAIGGVAGLMLGVLVVFFREYFDNTIKTKEDVERYLGLPVIGSIPLIEDKPPRGGKIYVQKILSPQKKVRDSES
jgi:capsular polysaccharide biosynthesis protein